MVIAGAINASMFCFFALFFKNGLHVEDLDVAYTQFTNLVGPVSLFGIGLLSAGLSSSSVGTMSGDIIMQGFIRMHIPLYLRRFITMIPPLVIIALNNLRSSHEPSRLIIRYCICASTTYYVYK